MGRRKLARELARLERKPGERRNVPPTFGERLAAWARASRHPIRAAAMAMAALALAWGIATGQGLIAAMLGAVAGVVAGELLARTRSRSITLLVGVVAVGALGWWAAGRLIEWRMFAAALGPGPALGSSSLLRWFALALAAVASLRVLAARHVALIGLELLVVGACVASMFASHREGVIARPLWLSDWAWEHGYDPADILLSVGAAAVVVLASLLVAESERRVSLASLLGIALIVALELALFQLEGLPEPSANSDLGLAEAQTGDRPKPTQGEGQGPGGSQGGKPDAGRDPEGGQGQGQGEGQEQQGGEQGQGQQDQQGQEQQQDQQQGGEQGQGEQQDQQQGGEQGQGEQQDQQQGEQGQGEQQDQQQQGGGQSQQQDQQQQGGGQSQQQQQQQQPNLDQQPSEGTKPAPMAVVLLGDDYSPPTQAFYFREDAWSHFNGSRLVASVRPDVDRDILRSFPARPINVPEAPPSDLRTEVHAEIVLLAKHAQPFALESAVSMQPEANPNPARFLRAYSSVSMAPDYALDQLVGREVGDPSWSEAQFEFYTQVPEDPRYAALAQEIIADLPPARAEDPFVQAVDIKLWMDEQLIYSSAERHAGVPDPTADFLFGNKTGYCVHFAHAAVYMWRSLGIPARVGVGYHVGEDQRRGSTLIIRGGDAHAWPELYLEGVGWVVLDIAARQNVDPPGQPLDEDLSDLLGEMARDEGPGDAEGEQKSEPVERRNFGRDMGFGLLFSLLISLLLLYLAKIWRRLAPRFASRKKLPRVGYRAAIDMLLDAGLVRDYGETREAFARRVAREVPSLGELTALHVAAAMGDPRRPESERPELDPGRWERGLRAVSGELPRSVPLWRRLLGSFDPSTVLRAR